MIGNRYKQVAAVTSASLSDALREALQPRHAGTNTVPLETVTVCPANVRLLYGRAAKDATRRQDCFPLTAVLKASEGSCLLLSLKERKFSWARC